MKSIIRSIVLKYKLENIPALSPEECEEAMVLIRYLMQRSETDEVLKELEGYLVQLEAKLKEKVQAIKPVDEE